jgi:signal transduction histidine kinase
MLARAPGISAHAQERLGIIHQQAQHATHLIRQILDFGRRNVLERAL